MIPDAWVNRNKPSGQERKQIEHGSYGHIATVETDAFHSARRFTKYSDSHTQPSQLGSSPLP